MRFRGIFPLEAATSSLYLILLHVRPRLHVLELAELCGSELYSRCHMQWWGRYTGTSPVSQRVSSSVDACRPTDWMSVCVLVADNGWMKRRPLIVTVHWVYAAAGQTTTRTTRITHWVAHMTPRLRGTPQPQDHRPKPTARRQFVTMEKTISLKTVWFTDKVTSAAPAVINSSHE